MLKIKRAEKEKEEVHVALQVSKEKVTPDVLVEGESSGSCFSEELHSESGTSEVESQRN